MQCHICSVLRPGYISCCQIKQVVTHGWQHFILCFFAFISFQFLPFGFSFLFILGLLGVHFLHFGPFRSPFLVMSRLRPEKEKVSPARKHE